ncbi:MAG: NTP transferase domain-containing protein [Chitinophagaceae bacterium]|jgi:NDP-sugar pyrophosphorylase family protein|nr:NTP transferase domain-containing protein [Chitinophagaceae bacterium]
MKAMLLAAGLGTRLKPWTDKHPKALAEVTDKSLLQRNVEYLQQYGIYDVIVNVHHFAGQIIDALRQSKGWGSNISVSHEIHEALETGGGLKQAAWYFKNEEKFLLMNVDVLTDLNLHQLIAQHEKNKCLATLATTNRKTSRYLLFDENNRLSGWENTGTGEKKIARHAETFKQQAFSCIHVINSKIFSLMKQEGKFSMIEVYLSLASKENIQLFEHSEGKFIDVGKPESIEKADLLFG